jgi:3-oxoacyl-[acyl-carrier protein] reductase
VVGRFAVQADIAKAVDVDRLFDAAERSFGPVGVVVNSAGIMKMLPIATSSEDDLDTTFATNVRGTFNVLKQAANRVPDGGRIVTFSSSVVAMSFPNYGPYAASKAAVEVLTRTLANELRGRQITVNAVAPGSTATELFFEGKSQEQIDRFAKLPPPGASRDTGGDRRCGRVPGRSGRWLGQRPGAACQRRLRLGWAGISA